MKVYKINHKIVWASIVLQMTIFSVWLFFAPDTLNNVSLNIYALILSGFLAIFLYVYFYAWMLNRMMIRSIGEACLLLFSIWLFCLLPNLFIALSFLVLSKDIMLYIMTFSCLALLINIITLPFSRCTRSIFTRY